MTTPTIQEIRIHPDAMSLLEANARRARAEAMGNLIVALIEGLRQRFAHKPGLGNLIGRMG
ncbi:MAG: RSP_7527 family protein [Betaproteobacteria bacterium]